MTLTKNLIVKQRLQNIAVKVGTILISDHKFNIKLFQRIKGYSPNLENPELFSEKLLYLKEHYRNPLQIICSDKYYVKDYLKLCGCDEIIRKPLAIYSNPEDIEFDKLPDRFFIRCSHMSGCNYVYDKKASNTSLILKMLSVCMKNNWYYNQREWNYKQLRPRIICEDLLIDSKGNMPTDYKFYCFGGEPKYFMVSKGEYDHKVKNHKFDMELNSIDKYFKEEPTLKLNEVELPDNFNEMVEYVQKLCKPFPHVRVDLYNVDGRIIFGELTFFSNGGVVNIISKEYEKRIGSWIDLEAYKGDMI